MRTWDSEDSGDIEGPAGQRSWEKEWMFAVAASGGSMRSREKALRTVQNVSGNDHDL